MGTETSVLPSEMWTILSSHTYVDALVPGADTDIAPIAIEILMMIQW
jgi:hypothetical protein